MKLAYWTGEESCVLDRFLISEWRRNYCDLGKRRRKRGKRRKRRRKRGREREERREEEG